MQRALAEFSIRGVKTTIPFHQRILADQDFQRGEFTTDFIQQKLDSEVQNSQESPTHPDQDDEARDTLLAAVLSAAIETYGNSENERFRITNIQPTGKMRSSWRMAGLCGGELQ